jgi:hypothetical protein
VIDKLYGADSGMLSGNEAYGQQQGRLSQSEQAVVAAQTRRDEAKQAYDEAVATTKLSGTPFDAGVQRGAAQRTRVSGAKIALDNAEKELAAAKIAPLPTQTGTRDTMERAPGAAVDQATQTVRAAARIGMAPIEAANEALTSAMGTVRPALDPIAQADKGLDDATRAITDTFSRQLFSKDEAQNERLGSKVVQGVVSTGMFAATGAAGRLAGFSPMWTTAIAGALPQAEGQFQQARSAQEINPTYAKEWMKQYGLDVSDKTANALVKWSMFATGLGIGATEAVPVAHLFERLEKASGGGFTRWIGIMAAQAGEEGLQEGVQQLLENAAVKGLLDPNRSIGKDVADNAMVGAISGALVSGVMAGPAVLAGRGAHPGMPAPAEPAPADLTGATPPPGAPPGATPPPPVAAPAASPHQEDLTPPAGRRKPHPPPPSPPGSRTDLSGQRHRAPYPAQNGLRRRDDRRHEPCRGRSRAWHRGRAGDRAGRGRSRRAGQVCRRRPRTEKPRRGRGTRTPRMRAEKVPAVDFSDLLPDGSRRSPAKITDQADIERAGAKVNTSPSEAQKEAGNYQKGHLKWKGLDFTIENPAGSIRSGKDADGTPWQAQLPAAYGYIKRTTGRDGDHVDVYFQGDGPIHVIDQIDPKTGKFDEHKVVIGPQTAEEASALYRSAFNDGDTVNRIGAITELTPSKLKAWLRIGKRTRPLGIIAKPAQERPRPA